MRLFKKKEKEPQSPSPPPPSRSSSGSDSRPLNLNPNRVFGVALKRLPPGVPSVLRACVDYFSEAGVHHEGLFRLSGNSDALKQLRQAFDSGTEPDLSGSDPNTVAGLLKLWCRELPEPLLTWELYDPFLATAAIAVSEASIATIKKLLAMLPPAHYLATKYLVSFLHRVQLEAARSKMTAANLAVVFAPNLLRSRSQDPAAVLQDSTTSNRLMETFIEHYFTLFEENEPQPQPKDKSKDKSLAWRTSRAPGETKALKHPTSQP